MPQTPSELSLAIQVTPTELMIADSSTQLAFMDSEGRGTYTSSLLLQPGELHQIVIQLANHGPKTLKIRLEMQIEGYFSPDWYSIQPAEQELAPGQKVDTAINFRLPEDFLEEYNPFIKRTEAQLEYHASLYAWSITSGSTQLLESTPFKFAVRPHSLYLNFLPAIYTEIDFVSRFLAIFEKTFEPAVQTLESLWAYLDPLTAPEGMLPFLANWVAWPMDARWNSAQQRRLIKNAVELYRWRGTRKGLRLYLHLYTSLPLDEHLAEGDKHISIEEVFQEGFVLGNTYVGKDSLLGGGRPFHFVVRLRPEYPSPIDEALVRKIIEQEKPAFCSYELYIEEQSPLYIAEPTVLEF
jgi:phage tail-like protein